MGSISVTNLGKAFKQYPTRWSRLFEWMDPTNRRRHHLKWVLQGINFTVLSGEAIGIIGMNGAGKSTLLKIITGTAQATSGNIQMSGRVAALLELGMGFHPDFTGRQNAFMAGQLLGFSAEQISQLMPAIESFAEIGDYIDQPVRVYSSGMQMRLAFSVATAQRPDVLIVDEALSVGDAYFQHKSFDRIREFRKQGTTLLIVSHDKGAIQSICDRAILLSEGKVAMEGEPEAVMDFYNALLANKTNQTVQQVKTAGGKIQTVSGTGEVVIEAVQIYNRDCLPVETVAIGEPIELRITCKAITQIDDLTVGFMIKDRLGQPVFGINTNNLKYYLPTIRADETLECSFNFEAMIGTGSYSVAVALHSGDAHIVNNYEWLDLAAVLNVININKPNAVGTSWLDVSVKHKSI